MLTTHATTSPFPSHFGRLLVLAAHNAQYLETANSYARAPPHFSWRASTHLELSRSYCIQTA